MKKKILTIKELIKSAREFCILESIQTCDELFGITDGKAVGTFMEKKIKNYLLTNFKVQIGNSASGIDLPGDNINTDIKVTSIKQPQSSCPFKNVYQKIYGLGYNILLFVYDKKDDLKLKKSNMIFVDCSFIEKSRTADYQITSALIQLLNNKANVDDIFAFLIDKNIPADEITLINLAKEILNNPPQIGYLTISNALQWRLQYSRIVALSEDISGITKIVERS